MIGPRQRALARQQQPQREERKDRQHEERARMAEAFDRVAGDERAERAGEREAESQPREIERALLGRAVRADDAVHADVHAHEAQAEQRAGQKENSQKRKQARQHPADGQRGEGAGERLTRTDAVDEPAARHRQQHRQEREQGHQRADGERRGTELQREQRRGHAAADEPQVAEGVERYEVDDRQRGFQTVIATPPHATAMPRTVIQPGATPNSASSSATANTGGRYIMLVTRAASPWRMSQCSTFTAPIEAKITRKAIAAAIFHAQANRKPSTAYASGARTASDAANCTTAAAFRSDLGQNTL